MTKEDYQRIATQLDMYLMPGFPPGKTFGFNENGETIFHDNTEALAFHRGQVDMFKRITKYLRNYHDDLEIMNKIFNEMTKK